MALYFQLAMHFYNVVKMLPKYYFAVIMHMYLLVRESSFSSICKIMFVLITAIADSQCPILVEFLFKEVTKINVLLTSSCIQVLV